RNRGRSASFQPLMDGRWRRIGHVCWRDGQGPMLFDPLVATAF
ncbi:MAG: hypothetical protein ACI9HH_003748, partial [Pseudomonadota bacterium]